MTPAARLRESIERMSHVMALVMARAE